MQLKTLLTFVFLIPAVLFAAENFRLEDLLSKNGKLMWDLNQEQFRIVSKLPLHSQDKHDNILRFYDKDTADKITLCGHAVPEVIFNFNKRKMQSVIISVYNRGDNGLINENEFNTLAAKVEKYIADLSQNSSPVNESRKFDKFHVVSQTYKGADSDFIIRRNRRGRHSEYIQLLIYPAGKAPKINESLQANINRKELSLNLILDKNGDSYIDVPMVNQGRKGYCAGATIERLMKYYGSNIDQQIIAQFAETDSYEGTDVRKLYNFLKSNDSKLKVHVDKLMHDTTLENNENIEKFHILYNSFAKKKKRPRINLKNFVSGKGRNRKIDFPALFGSYEYEVFKNARCRNEKMVEKFNKNVKEYLEKGIPLIWVTYTFSNTAKGQPMGEISMHMRIINGYNEKSNNIIYTDSWGKGHEKKRLSLNDAWARTLMLIAVSPR